MQPERENISDIIMSVESLSECEHASRLIEASADMMLKFHNLQTSSSSSWFVGVMKREEEEDWCPLLLPSAGLVSCQQTDCDRTTNTLIQPPT